VSAGALVETVKGDISVTLKSLAESKPLSFTSMSGEVDIHAPADLKASVRFRTHRGTILTNFDDKVLVTKTEFARRAHKDKITVTVGTSGKKDTASVLVSPTDTTQAKSQTDDDWREGLRDSIREATEDAVEAARDAAEAAREGCDRQQVRGWRAPVPTVTANDRRKDRVRDPERWWSRDSGGHPERRHHSQED
jgi:DNA-binding protein YbaB